MDCTRYRQPIHELADGTLGPIRRAELEQHLDVCEGCRRLAADLERVRELAGSLGPLEPPARVWMQVAGQLRREGRVAPPAAAAPASRRHAAWLALAAALVLAVSASLLLLMRDTASGPAEQQPATQAGNAAPADPVQAMADELQAVEQHLENMLVRLEAMAAAEPGEIPALDPQTLASIQKGRLVLDQAISESRAALRTEPGNQAARDSLFDALRRKVALLQDTVVLMNEMRRGDAAGAAQALDGLNKS